MAHNKKLSEVDNADSINLKGCTLPRFGAVPYHRVVERFYTYCKAQDFMCPNQDPRPEHGKPGHDEWEPWVFPQEHRAAATLEMLCREDDLDLVKGLDLVKPILQKLKEKYKGDMTAEFFTLQTKWEKLTKESGETISEFFCRAKDIANRLKDLDQPITEPAIIAKLMSCLPSDYDLVIALFKERSLTLTTESMSLNAFQQSMQKREAEIGLHSVTRKTDKALQARAVDNEEDGKKQPWWEKKRGGGRRPRGRGGIGSGGGGGRGHHHHRGGRGGGVQKHRGRGRGDRHQRGGKQQAEKFEGQCNHCGKYGHKKSECWKFSEWLEQQKKGGHGIGQQAGNPNLPPHLRDQGARANQARSQSTGAGTSYQGYYDQDFAPRANPTFNPARAYHVLPGERAHYSGVVNYNPTGSVLDTGCTQHMTPVKEALVNYQPFNVCPTVYVGNGIPCTVLGHGDLYVRAKTSYGTNDIKITDVWYVPDLIETLISVNMLQDKGTKCTIIEQDITVYDRDWYELFVATYQKSIGYVPNWEMIAPQENALAFFARQTKEDALLWHARLGHCSFDVLHTMVSDNHATGIRVPAGQFKKYKDDACPVCIAAKLQRKPYVSVRGKPRPKPGEALCSDVAGPYQVLSLGGAEYMFMLVDYSTSKFWAIPMQNKDDVETLIPPLVTHIEKQTGNLVQYFQTDNGGEYIGNKLAAYFESKDIKHMLSLPYEHQQNGVAENAIKQCNNIARALLYNSALPLHLWGEAVDHAAYLHNITYSAAVGKSPNEAFYGVSPDLSLLRTFGCITYLRTPDELRKKLDPKAEVGYYLGPAPASKGVRVLCKHESGKWHVKYARDIVCVERYLTHPNVPAVQYFERVGTTEAQGADQNWELGLPVSAPPEVAGSRPASDLSLRLEELLKSGVGPIGAEDLADHQVAEGVDPGQPAESVPAAEVPGTGIQKSSEDPPRVEQRGDADRSGHSLAPTSEERRYPARKRQPPRNMDPAYNPRSRRKPNPKTRPPATLRFADTAEGAAQARYVRGVTDEFDFALARAVLGEMEGYEPTSFRDAVQQPDWDDWKLALDEEMKSLLENDTWELVEREPGMKVIPSKWVFKLKRDSEGRINRYKCRLVAGGHRQKYGVDFEETFAPVSKATSLRVLLSIAAYNKWKVHQLDVKTAFLHGDIDTVVYMQQPEGFETGHNLVCRLKKCLYGLKQAPRAWYEKLSAFLQELGFAPNIADPSIWIGAPYGKTIMLSLVVDDTLVTCEDESHTLRFIRTVLDRFDGHTSFAEYYVGMKLNWQEDGTVILTQKPHIEKILKDHFPEGVKPRSTPCAIGFVFTKKGKALDTRKYNYPAIVGSFLFIACYTRVDIVAIVNRFAKYVSNPTQEMLEGLRHLAGYLLHTINVGLHLGRNSDIVMYADSDFASCVDTRRSHTGWVFVFFGAAVCWQSKCQTTVAVSTTEAEYQAVSSSAREALWLRQLLPSMGIQLKQFMIRTDSMGALNSLKNPQITQRTKHIDVQHHFVRQRCARGEITLEFVTGEKNVADFLTKPVPKQKHCWSCHKAGMAQVTDSGKLIPGLYAHLHHLED
jgi:hypothetical protein